MACRRIPPEHILELRAQVRLRKSLVDQRTEWQQRMHAQLFHQGVAPGFKLWSRAGRACLDDVELSPAGREVIETGIRMLDYLDAEIAPLDRKLSWLARRQSGCRALRDKLYGVGFMTAAAIVAELGDCRRFRSSDDAVRYAGLDVTVYESNSKRAPGHLSRQTLADEFQVPPRQSVKAAHQSLPHRSADRLTGPLVWSSLAVLNRLCHSA